MKPINILHIEDDEDDVCLVNALLHNANISFTTTIVSSKESLMAALEINDPHIVLSDHSIPAFNSLEALKIVKQKKTNVPFILVTGNTSEGFAANIIKAGADDYIFKDSPQRLSNGLLTALGKYESANAGTNYKTSIRQAVKASEEMTEGVLNSLASHIALINSSRTIVKVNNSWNTFASSNGAANPEKYGIGANEDDGVGFNISQNRKGVGLTNIYNRAESYNGTVDIVTEPGRGCKLTFVLPVAAAV